MKIESVKYILMVNDMDRAVGFYRDTLGLEVKTASPMWSEMAFGDAIVALHGGGNRDHKKTGLGIQVDDVTSACAEIVSGGGRVLSEPEDRPGEPIKLARMMDTEGNAFDLTQYVG